MPAKELSQRFSIVLPRSLVVIGLVIYAMLGASPVLGASLAGPPTQVADLSISNTDGQTTALPGTSVTYTIIVADAGPDRAKNVVVIDNFPASLSGVVWACSASPGSQCGATSGSNNINTMVSLKPGGKATFLATGMILNTATGLLVNTAYLLPPAGIIDPTPSDHSATDVDTLIPFTVTASNNGPTALGNTTVFTATSSGGSNVTYQWAFGDGSAVAGNPATHVYGAAGSYAAVVTAINSNGITATATTQVVVERPIVGLTAANSSPTTLGNSTTFTATVATGSNVTYQWAFGDGTLSMGSGNPVIHTYGAAGVYTVIVTAANSVSQATATTTANVTNLPPIANAGADQNVLVGANVMLDGSASYDPDGHLPLTYQWQQVGGAAVVLSSNTITRPTFIAPSVSALLTFSLVVTDARGAASAPDQVVVKVSDRPIVGLAAVNNSPTLLGNSTSFTATIMDGSNVGYHWTFGDGGVAIGNPLTHTYTAAGVYTVAVTATNGSGSITATTKAIVTAPVPMSYKLYLPLVARDWLSSIVFYLPLILRDAPGLNQVDRFIFSSLR